MLLKALSHLFAELLSQNLTNCETTHFSLVRTYFWITDAVVYELKSLSNYLTVLSKLRSNRRKSFRTNNPPFIPYSKLAVVKNISLYDFLSLIFRFGNSQLISCNLFGISEELLAKIPKLIRIDYWGIHKNISCYRARRTDCVLQSCVRFHVHRRPRVMIMHLF